jgi:hypothetical protein
VSALLLELACEVLVGLKTDDDATLHAWHELHKTGKSGYFGRLRQAAAQAGAPVLG